MTLYSWSAVKIFLLLSVWPRANIYSVMCYG